MTATGHLEHHHDSPHEHGPDFQHDHGGGHSGGVRSKATDLSDAERDRFLEAVIRLQRQPAPGGSTAAVGSTMVLWGR